MHVLLRAAQDLQIAVLVHVRDRRVEEGAVRLGVGDLPDAGGHAVLHVPDLDRAVVGGGGGHQDLEGGVIVHVVQLHLPGARPPQSVGDLGAQELQGEGGGVEDQDAARAVARVGLVGDGDDLIHAVAVHVAADGRAEGAVQVHARPLVLQADPVPDEHAVLAGAGVAGAPDHLHHPVGVGVGAEHFGRAVLGVVDGPLGHQGLGVDPELVPPLGFADDELQGAVGVDVHEVGRAHVEDLDRPLRQLGVDVVGEGVAPGLGPDHLVHAVVVDVPHFDEGAEAVPPGPLHRLGVDVEDLAGGEGDLHGGVGVHLTAAHVGAADRRRELDRPGGAEDAQQTARADQDLLDPVPVEVVEVQDVRAGGNREAGLQGAAVLVPDLHQGVTGEDNHFGVAIPLQIAGVDCPDAARVDRADPALLVGVGRRVVGQDHPEAVAPEAVPSRGDHDLGLTLAVADRDAGRADSGAEGEVLPAGDGAPVLAVGGGQPGVVVQAPLGGVALSCELRAGVGHRIAVGSLDGSAPAVGGRFQARALDGGLGQRGGEE